MSVVPRQRAGRFPPVSQSTQRPDHGLAQAARRAEKSALSRSSETTKPGARPLYGLDFYPMKQLGLADVATALGEGLLGAVVAFVAIVAVAYVHPLHVTVEHVFLLVSLAGWGVFVTRLLRPTLP